MSIIIRLILTVALMYVVWCNSHWSVALSISLLSINVEAKALIVELRRRARKPGPVEEWIASAGKAHA